MATLLSVIRPIFAFYFLDKENITEILFVRIWVDFRLFSPYIRGKDCYTISSNSLVADNPSVAQVQPITNILVK